MSSLSYYRGVATDYFKIRTIMVCTSFESIVDPFGQFQIPDRLLLAGLRNLVDCLANSMSAIFD